MELDSRVYVIEIFFNFNSKGTKDLNFSPTKEFTTFKIFRRETLFIADYETVYRNSHLIRRLQNYGSKKALFCGMITLLNE